MNASDTLKIVIVGHVDHGKSTLIGRIFHDTGAIHPSRVADIEATCRRQGRPFELAYLMDALEEEREQNVTIDTAQSFFATEKRRYVLIDAPGHEEFLKNMVTGAASADAAVLLLDAVEGVREQTYRHAHLLSLLGIKRVVVTVNKLDAVDYSRERHAELEEAIRHHLATLGIEPAHVIPISAREGENVAARIGKTPWYEGKTVLEALDSLENVASLDEQSLRFTVQDVYKVGTRRIYAGRVESGTVRPGDEVVFSPSGRRARVASVEKWGKPAPQTASAGESIGLTFTEEIFVERGEILSSAGEPVPAATRLTASLFWLARKPLVVGGVYVLKLGTAEVECLVREIRDRTDAATLGVLEESGSTLEAAESAVVRFDLRKPLAADLHESHAITGRFVVEDGFIISGGGIIREIETAGENAEVVEVAEEADISTRVGAVALVPSAGLLENLDNGGSAVIKLGSATQVESVADFAFRHHLDFTFSRRGNAINLKLFKAAA